MHIPRLSAEPGGGVLSGRAGPLTALPAVRGRERSRGREAWPTGARPGPGPLLLPLDAGAPRASARRAGGNPAPHRQAGAGSAVFPARFAAPADPLESSRSRGVKRSPGSARWVKASLRTRVARRSAGQTAAGKDARRSRPACTRTRIGPHRRPERNG